MKLPRLRRRTVAALAGGLFVLTASTSAALATTSSPQAHTPQAQRSLHLKSGTLQVLPDGTVTLNGRAVANVKDLNKGPVTTASLAGGSKTVQASRPADGGWDDQNNCQARASVTMSASTNPDDPTASHVSLHATVNNRNPFVGCRLTSTVVVKTFDGRTIQGPGRQLLGCGTLDPTCYYWKSGDWEIDGEVPELAEAVQWYQSLGFTNITAGSLLKSVDVSFTRKVG